MAKQNAKRQSMDGCAAATYIAYAFSEVATIYPITPIAEMGQLADKWNALGIKNLLGSGVQVKELESELGAAGATHGAACGGALATTFTNSQGLMLMIPNMFKMAGELLPVVMHVGCRSTAAHALSIFGDHQDVMATRTTGVTMLASASVQETHDLAIVAHMAAIEGSLPVVHFFDGWRTSNETSTIEVTPYADLAPLLPIEKIKEFRAGAMNPEHPDVRGTAQNWDVFFQNKEAANSHYNAFPGIVQAAMDKAAPIIGRQYHLFDYVGDPQAEYVIVSMCSSCEVIESTVDYLNQKGYKVGLVKVRLFRPFAPDALMAAIPKTAKVIAALDRTKEPGSQGEPLYLDVATAVLQSGREGVKVIGGRYGLSSKEFDPSMVKRIYDELAKPSPKNGFTIGINDDVTHTSLEVTDHVQLKNPDSTESIFFGIGGDGTVGSTKIASQIICDAAGLYAQAYFQYSAKKASGYTRSQLRFSSKPIKSEYGIEMADYVNCNKDTYVNRFDLIGALKPGGIFVLNSHWTDEELNTKLPAELRRTIAQKKVKFYNIDANAISMKVGLGERVNMIMLTTFFKLMQIIPFDQAITHLKSWVEKTYMHEGAAVVKMNNAAIDATAAAIHQVDYPPDWASATEAPKPKLVKLRPGGTPARPGLMSTQQFVTVVADVCDRLDGDNLPVSVFSPDGKVPLGTTAYEKRRIALCIPQWIVDKCVECTECSFVCPHAAIRPYVLTLDEKAAAPAGFITKEAWDHEFKAQNMQYRIQVYPEDCTGCGSCALVCPGDALKMVPLHPELEQQLPLWQYAVDHVSIKDGIVPRNTVNGSQFYVPMLEFSGACAGCGETPYVKLLTQLMGERMIIANATGCSSIWGADHPSVSYCTNQYGKGAAWGNSLFEDNAEYGYGIAVAIAHRRQALAEKVRTAIADKNTCDDVRTALQDWLDNMADAVKSDKLGQIAIQQLKLKGRDVPGCQEILDDSDMFAKKSIWAIGGDGWAYDIGFAGLDHVLAQNIDINLLVMDTECYSNTGGQTSKATPLGSTAKYSYDGKRTFKKDLGRMMMTYGSIYVASIALGHDFQQAINAMVEADAYPGPSIVICYCPCREHGIRAGLGTSIIEERKAVASGYWPVYRFNPQLAAEGKPALIIDYQKPDGQLIPFINGEDRYADLKIRDAVEAARLQPMLKEREDQLFDIIEYTAGFNGTVNLPPDL